MLNEVYGGNTRETRKRAIEDEYYLDWSEERIKNAFNCGKGTIKDLKRYMRDNEKYCVFVEV